MNKIFLAFSVLLVLLGGCVQSPYYQQTFSIPNNSWDVKYSPKFSVEIEDTSAYYNSYLLLRHTNNYNYANIWINILVKAPGDSVFNKTAVEVPLATPQGKWLGLGMGEIYEQRRMIVLNHQEIPITDELIAISAESINNIFRKKGRYEIRLEQNMRENSLSDILHVGLRVEKSSQRKIAATKPKPLS
jgi:gliding motility-associated lipoprotein GldH